MPMDVELGLDLLLGLTLVWLAWRILTLDALFEEAVLFIVFGLVMALVWVRLGAPDIALAEAAIGAGLTGALVLDAVGQVSDRARAERGRGESPPADADATTSPGDTAPEVRRDRLSGEERAR
jgi:energy-converting hydrogenase B subunit D